MNSFSILLIGYCIIDFSDAETDALMKERVGWVVFAIMLLMIIINITLLVVRQSRSTYYEIKRFLIHRRNSKKA